MKHYILLFLLLAGGQLQAQRVLRLDECRNMALEYNKNLKKAALDKQKAVAGQKEARTAYMPAIDASGTATFMPTLDAIEIPGFHLPAADADGNITGDSEAYFPGLSLDTERLRLYQAQLAMTVPIYAGSQIRYANKMADHGVSIAEQAYALESDQVIQTTDEAYWQIISLRENLKVAHSYVAMLDSLEGQLSDMYELGLAPKSEQLKVTVQKNDAELALLKANNGLKILKMHLCQLIGLPLDTDIELPLEFKQDVELPDMTNAWTIASQNRKELQIMEDQLAIAGYQKKTTAAQYRPTVGAQISYGYIDIPNFNEGQWNTTIAGQVSVPVFHWGEKKHKLTSAKMDLEKAQLDLENSREMIQLEVQQLVVQVQESYETILLQQKACTEATESLEEVKASYDAGLNTTTDLLNAQASWQQTQAKLIDALTAYEIAQTAYKKGIGMLNVNKGER